MFLYQLDGKKYLFCPKLWWDAEYYTDPAKYYKIKYGRHTRFRVIICLSCENKLCASLKSHEKLLNEIKCIIQTGHCPSCTVS
jgi:hypothetical protein